MIRHQLPNGEIIHARVEAVYPTIEAGSVTLVHSDGPYGLNKAEWDKVRDLAAWYRPHIAEWGRICAPSASVYLWNTAEGWAAIHPEMVAAGWHFASLVTWDKINSPACIGKAASSVPVDATEVCGVYQRGEPYFKHWEDGANVWTFSQKAIAIEKIKTENMVPHRVTGAPVAESLHPCQKPLLFARRIVEASSRLGDLVFEPFGGTCRIAAACEDIARWEPEKARRYACVEMDEDGRGYIPAVLAAIRGDAPTNAPTGQMGLFGKPAA